MKSDIKSVKHSSGKLIVHITTVHEALDSRIFHRECRTLANAGYSVAIVGRHDRPTVIDGITVIPIRSRKSRVRRFIFSSWEIFRKVRKLHVDVIHFHDPELIPLGMFFKLLHLKVVYDIHEDYGRAILHKKWIPQELRSPVAIVFDRFEPLLTRIFDLVVVAPPAVTRRLKWTNNPKVIEIQNFPRLEDYEIDVCQTERAGDVLTRLNNLLLKQDSIAEDFDANAPRNLFTYVGAIGELRGAENMIRAIGKCKSSNNSRLVLAGNCDDEYLQRLMSLEGWKRTIYLGRISPSEVSTLLLSSTAGVTLLHPIQNYLEQFPTKLFEYMAAGIPFIASDFDLYKFEIQASSCGILVDPLNIEEIADALDTISEHAHLSKKMGANGKKFAISKFNWNLEGKKLLSAYKLLLTNEFN